MMISKYSFLLSRWMERYLGLPDYRVRTMVFFNTPFWPICIITAYLLSLAAIRFLMRNRKGFDLKQLLRVYDFLQVCFSTYIFLEVAITAYKDGYKLSCQPLKRSRKYLDMRMVNAFWFFYLSKVIDLADTAFLLLRKKKKQISFLHVYHHGSMIFNWYLGVLYLPGGQAFFSVMMNSMVHIFMYTYYFLSSFGPNVKKHLWWKKYLTLLQLLQFTSVMLHIIYGEINHCPVPFWLPYFTLAYVTTIIALFFNFYVSTYRWTTKRSKPRMKTFSVPNEVVSHVEDLRASGDTKVD